MTEDEAKTKWCPFAKVPAEWLQHPDGSPDPRGPAVNRYFSGHDPVVRCIASACMAWRWGRVVTVTEFTLPAGGGDGTPTKWSPSQTDGFCGLAGSPQ